MDSAKRYRIKIISVGELESGKSCLIKRYCEKRYVPKCPTVGIDFGVVSRKVKGTDLKVNIFDMSGHSLFYEIRKEFYQDTQGVVMVYDVSNKSSFSSLPFWIEEMKEEITDKHVLDNVIVAVCGNKTDKKREVDLLDAQIWANSHGFYYYEMSAKNGEGVMEAFEKLFEEIIYSVDNKGIKRPFESNLGYTQEQAEMVIKLKNAKNNYERLGISYDANKDDVNKAYKKLAFLLHPDKNVAPGSEEAFKLVCTARRDVLGSLE